MDKKLIRHKIMERLLQLEVGEKLNKKALIESIWGTGWSFYLSRSFDVHFVWAKKEIAKDFPERLYKSQVNTFITRVK